MKKTWFALLSVLGLFLFALPASAHVRVSPNQTVQGADDQVFTIQVPTEKNIPTVKLLVKIPAGIDVEATEPVPGWQTTTVKDSNGKITSITWTAVGKGLEPGQFMLFPVVGTVSDKATSLVWKAAQTYQDGSEVDWVEPENGQTPAAVTKVLPAKSTSAAAGSVVAPAQLPFALILAIVAVVLSSIALLIALFRKPSVKQKE